MDEFRIEIIKTWFEKANEFRKGLKNSLDKQPFATRIFYANALIYCSIAYEAFIFGKFGRSGRNNTVTKNRKSLSEYFQVDFEKTQFSDNFKTALKLMKDESNKEQIRDMSGRGESVRIKDVSDLDNILEVIYRVRSNLLHGGKEMSNNRNALLMENSFHVLVEIMDKVLRKEGIIKG